jgi:hypothetical protein
MIAASTGTSSSRPDYWLAIYRGYEAAQNAKVRSVPSEFAPSVIQTVSRLTPD